MAYFLGKKGEEAVIDPDRFMQDISTQGTMQAAGTDLTDKQKCKKNCRERYAPGSEELRVCLEGCTGETPAPPEGEKVIACVVQPDGTSKCRLVLKSTVTQAQIDACAGKVQGVTCMGGEPVQPEGEECPQGKWFTHFPKDGPCPEGYTLVTRRGTGWDGYQAGADGRCECTSWLEKYREGRETKPTGIGEYQYPAWITEIMGLLGDRSKYLLDPANYGYSQELMDKMFGREFETTRAAEAGAREQALRDLSSQGMIGTGAEIGTLRDIGWGTEQKIADLARDLFIASEMQRKEDITGMTDLADQLLRSGLGYEQMLEAINAARRGERSSALELLLGLLGTLQY